jgi:uncharacterized cupin superfamily protein
MAAKVTRLLKDGDPKTGMEPSDLIGKEDFTTGDTHEVVHVPFTNTEGNVTAGVWECAPCKQQIDRYNVDELCTILSGSVTLTDADGHSETFTTGDSFVVPKEFSGTWHVTETLRKFWMIYEPKEG